MNGPEVISNIAVVCGFSEALVFSSFTREKYKKGQNPVELWGENPWEKETKTIKLVPVVQHTKVFPIIDSCQTPRWRPDTN